MKSTITRALSFAALSAALMLSSQALALPAADGVIKETAKCIANTAKYEGQCVGTMQGNRYVPGGTPQCTPNKDGSITCKCENANPKVPPARIEVPKQCRNVPFFKGLSEVCENTEFIGPDGKCMKGGVIVR